AQVCPKKNVSPPIGRNRAIATAFLAIRAAEWRNTQKLARKSLSYPITHDINQDGMSGFVNTAVHPMPSVRVAAGTATETPARWSLTRHFVLIIKSATGFTRQNSMSIRWTVICDARNASWKRRRMIKSAGRCAGNCGIWMTGCFARDVTCTTQNAAFTASPTSDKDRPIRLWEQKISGAAGGSRTPDLRLRRPVLYPAELLPHAMKLGHFTVAAAKHQT